MGYGHLRVNLLSLACFCFGFEGRPFVCGTLSLSFYARVVFCVFDIGEFVHGLIWICRIQPKDRGPRRRGYAIPDIREDCDYRERT